LRIFDFNPNIFEDKLQALSLTNQSLKSVSRGQMSRRLVMAIRFPIFAKIRLRGKPLAEDPLTA